ncbi:MAG TPA: pitrilysin family protein [Gemmatimonadales bacterium]|nr:pitrilysin family protein [Gemmatimonadales bacterium]
MPEVRVPVRSPVRLLAVLAVAAPIAPCPAPLAAQSAPIEIPYERHELPNGLTLLIHEDHKAPIVAVNVWYHVGSKNERPGRTGFAHLFEHLMFNGSEHYNQDYFYALQQAGATDVNGTTNEDRTNYFQNVPVNALDQALWLESDRMGHLLGAVTQARLDEQRGVVQNEKREGENEPYGRVWEFLNPRLYPANHPYSWSVIGSMEDLDAAKLEDVKEWFQTYYGPANATLVVAGDVKPDEVKAKVERYFGDIPSGPPVTRQEAWIAKRTGSQRGIMQDRVPQARIYKVWNIPQWDSPESDHLTLLAQVLSTGKSSRLFKRLVYDEQTATAVTAYTDLREIGGLFVIQATVKPGGDVATVERAIDQELARLLAAGPTVAELQRVKTLARAGFVRGVERIGGFGGKSDVLAQGAIFADDPDFYQARQRRIAAATPAQVRAAGSRWLSDGVYTLEVVPFPDYRTAAAGADRAALPKLGPPVEAGFPAIERDTLSNGLKILLARRTAIPQVQLDLLLDAGYAADQFGVPGTASLAMAMLDEGTRTRSAIQISDQLAGLGAGLGAGSSLDVSAVSLEALREHLDASLALYADVILNPSFPQADFERLKRQRIAQIRREKSEPVGMALRVLPRLLYGEGHAYANPWTGSGTEASTERITREDLVRFHRTWFKPDHATMIVVGATTMDEIRPKLERLFAGWRPGEVPRKNIAPVESPARPVVYLMDRPEAVQTLILAGDLAPPKANPNEPSIETMNTVLGGTFTSRVNMNLREEKHWSYGAYTFFRDARGQRPFVVYAPVQTDKTAESLTELGKELQGIVGGRPATAEELERAVASLTLTLPGAWETMDAVSATMSDIVAYGLDDRYYDTYAERVRSQTVDSVTAAARAAIQPERLVWVVVGDRSKIEAPIRALNLGEIRLIDADGNPLGGA